MLQLAIRAATSDDVEPIAVALEHAMASTPSHRGGHLFRVPQRSGNNARGRLFDALADPHATVLVATRADVISGAAIITVRGAVGLIEELFGDSETETGLLEEACLWCSDHACTGIDIEVLPGDRAAKSLCEDMGFKARSLTMHRPLSSH